MKVFRSLAVAFLCAGAAWGQASPAPEPPPKAAPADPVSKVPLRGLMARLAEKMAGQRVIAVGYGGDGASFDEAAYSRAGTLLERAQVIAEACSEPSETLIPFQDGASLAIAAETRLHLNPNLGTLSLFEASARGSLLEGVMLSLPVAQLRGLGSRDGLAVAELPAGARAAVARAFGPPMRVEHPNVDEGGDHANDAARSIDEEIDWATARVRVRLRMGQAMGELDGDAYGILDGGSSVLPVLCRDQTRSPFSESLGLDLPVYEPGPNTYKPTDLAGKSYRSPLGFSGVWRVKDVVQRLSKATGLDLVASPVYDDVPVFLGSPAITVGELIDALRLCLTASWRRLGDTYILAWDRIPLAAIDLSVKDAVSRVSHDVRKREREMNSDPAWLNVMESIPFAEDDPLALDADQRKVAFGEPQAGAGATHDEWTATRIPWERMNPEQQDYLRKRARDLTVSVPASDPSQPEDRRPWTEADLRKISLDPVANVEWHLWVDGIGWIRAGAEWYSGSLSAYVLRSVRQKSDPKAREARAMAELPPEIRRSVENPQPVEMPSDLRGLIVPPLSAPRLEELAREMKRHGFNTLLYPVLFGGYATFESRFFPLHPSLKGEDGFAAAVAAMKGQGIQVVGFLNTLTWQNEEDNVHWLTRHADWMDVDALGRPRLEWYRRHPDGGWMSALRGEPRANYVRASEPLVAARLEGLVREFADRPGAAGVAFDQWRPASSPGIPDADEAPSLGFSATDRLAKFRRTGQDPADVVMEDAVVPAPLRVMGYANQRPADPNAEAIDPHDALVDGLISAARSARKSWKVWVFDSEPSGEPQPGVPQRKRPQPDIAVGNFLWGAIGPSGKRGVVLPVERRSLLDIAEGLSDTEDSGMPEALRRLPSIAICNLALKELSPNGSARLPAMLYDFRTAPELISSSLQWVKAPEPVKEAAK